MKWQTIVRKIAAASPAVPSGMPGVVATLKSQATSQVLGTGLTDGNGMATFTMDGNPGPTRLEVQDSSALRYQASGVRGPDGPANIAELPWALHAMAGVLPEQGQQFNVIPGSGLSVVVAPGVCIIPGGFVYVQYGYQTLTLTPSTSGLRLDTIVIEADDNESSATYGRTRLVVQSSGANLSGARVYVASVFVNQGASSITTGNIVVTAANQKRSLVGIIQSTPVMPITSISYTGSAIANAASLSRTATLSGLDPAITYDVTATATFMAALPSTAGTGGTQTVTLTATSGSTLATRSNTYKFVNTGDAQMLSASIAWSGTVASGAIALSLTYATNGAAGTLYGHSFDAVAVPRR